MKKIFPPILAVIIGCCCHAQPFTKNYIMAFHTCDTTCTGFQDHMVNLAESNDGTNWTVVPNFIPYQSSVPDPVIRGNKLYVYTPNKVKRFDNSANSWDANPVPVSVVDVNNNPVNYVDPSAIIDSSGNIVLFFLRVDTISGNPAGCITYPCTKYFNSAVEVSGSDGTQFVMQSGDRKSILLNSSPQTASDPDIYFDGTKYILYISKGLTTVAFQSSTMHGSYISFPNLSGDILTTQGGIPCGYFDASSNQYWTYIHANVSGNTVIRQAIHNDFNSQLTNFNTVISGPIIGEPSSTKTESPGFCVNDFLVSVSGHTIGNDKLFIFPNPTSGKFQIAVGSSSGSEYKIEIYNVLGEKIAPSNSSKGGGLNFLPEFIPTWSGGGQGWALDISSQPSGIYFLQIKSDGFIQTKKLEVIK